MAKARCVLCGTELVGTSCPKCLPGDTGDGRIDRDTDKARPSVRRAGAVEVEADTAKSPVLPAPDAEGETEKVPRFSPGEAKGGSPGRPTREASPEVSPKPAVAPAPAPKAAAAPEAPEPEPSAAPVPKSTGARKAAWYALAGTERPKDQFSNARPTDEAIPASDPSAHDELKGYHPAGIIFVAMGVAQIAAAATGQVPDVADAVINITAGGALLKHYSWARFLAFAFGALHIAKMGLGLALTGSSLFVLAMLPTLCVFGAFLFDDAKWRAAAAGVGVALAFSWVGAYAFRPVEAKRSDPMADYVIEGGRFTDEAMGLSVVAPAGTQLYDAAKVTEALKDAKAGILGMVVKNMVMKRVGGERLLMKGTEIEVDGMVRTARLPPQITSASTLVSIFGEESKPARSDELVPRGLKDAAELTCEGWMHRSRRVVLARAADGRLLTAVCNARAAGGERLCQAFFEGVSFKPVLAK